MITMKSVWAGKPAKNAATWKAFDNIRSFVMFLSLVNVVLKGVAVFFLSMIYKAGSK